MVQPADRTQAERAERNRARKTTRVYHTAAAYADEAKFREVALKGGTKPPVAYRTPGRGAIMGNNLVDRRQLDSCHLIQCASIEPGNRKYRHHHVHAETVWVILEGSGDLCHALPGQWHGLGNTGSVRLQYISVEGPMPYGGAFDTTVVCEGE